MWVRDRRRLLSIQLCIGNIPVLGLIAVDRKYTNISEKPKATSQQLQLLNALFTAACRKD